MTMEYVYVECEEGESQYDSYDLNEQSIVPAIYVHARVPQDKGNPYIEALPYPRKGDNIMRAYTRTLAEFDYNKIKDMSTLDKMLQVETLRNIRFPLPFHKDLEFYFYNALLTSYRARKKVTSENTEIKYFLDNKEYNTSTILTGDSSEPTNAGFSLIGYSGCGKSSAISCLVLHYPQVIMHKSEDGGYYPQITYLVVNCIANSNFKALYQGIGEAIDKALGNIKPVYEREIEKTAGLGGKAEKVKKLIEKFAIGIIIFDEIQLIDFKHTRENTFDSLLTLANRTKTSIAAVGTEDAVEKMFKELRTARRIGKMINGHKYCKSKQFFGYLVKNIFQYQWFDEPVSVTDDIIDALYDVTKGIVDQLIGVYSCMNLDYINRKSKPQINSEYIRNISKKYYPGLQDVLANIETDINENVLGEIKNTAELRINKIIDDAKQEKEMSRIMLNSEIEVNEQAILKEVISRITGIYDEYTPSMIEEAFNKVIKLKSSEGKTEKEISRLVIERLQKKNKKSSKKIKVQPPSTDYMKDFLDID